MILICIFNFYVFIVSKSFKETFFFINSEFTLDLINLYLFYITIITLNFYFLMYFIYFNNVYQIQK